MQVYHHYADYLIKRAMSDLGSMDRFLRYVFFTDFLWQQKVLGVDKEITSFEGALQRENLNKAIKQETLDGKVSFGNTKIIIEGENSISVEDIYQLLRQEAAVLEPRRKRKPLIAMISSLADSPIHRIDKKSCPFLEITNILGPKTFIGFASVNLYLIESDFYREYFKSLFESWSQDEVENILNGSFSSLLFGYCVRRLWLGKADKDQLGSLKCFLNNIWKRAEYSSLFYETFILFRKEMPELCHYFDEGEVKMKSFVDTMPPEARRVYEDVLVKPVIKEYGEKLRQVELEKKMVEGEREKERLEREREREREDGDGEGEREVGEGEREREDGEGINDDLSGGCCR